MKQWLKQAITNPWIKQYIMLGYGAKGTVYLFIGILAIQAAMVSNRQASGTYQTLTFLVEQPLGKLFVCLLAVTLSGYVLRRLLQTILTPGKSNPWSLKCIFQRLGYIMSGLSYAGVAYSALNLVFELGEADDTIEDLANQIFDQALGEWLILLGGIAVITIGIGYVYGAYTGSYISDFHSDHIHHRLEKWATRIGKLGVAARGIAFILTGIFLTEAAIFGNSDLAGGLQNALRIIAIKPLGWLWLSLIGFGFICYGIYMYIAAVYRRYTIR
ncbi:protein of unknown function (DUF1206) [Xenococcus sp. PCC 7305]|uniref:DUF1206 domain-containing protein n=1 Tax=Xenococcus sp. PCC 7305 TaxID=102125 RepID=UPI0002ABDE0F|nr:DUF1206 domain-containing protein [Xenococcus sp. PCC 7305]ELS03953.1 protein of unknown function (DUF1206) [Xenococcus sp. PCC 7305]